MMHFDIQVILDFFGYSKKNYITNAQFRKEMFSN